MSPKKPHPFRTYTITVREQTLTLKSMIEGYAGPSRADIKEHLGGGLEAWLGSRIKGKDGKAVSRKAVEKYEKSTNIETSTLFRILNAFDRRYDLRILVSFEDEAEWHEIKQFELGPIKNPVGRPKRPLLLPSKPVPKKKR